MPPKAAEAATSIVSAKISLDLTKQLFAKLAPDYANFGEWEIQMRDLMLTLGMDAIMFDGAPDNTKTPGELAAAKFFVNGHLSMPITSRMSLHEMWLAIQAAAPSARDRRIASIREIMGMQVHAFPTISDYKLALDAKLSIITASGELLTATEAHQLSSQIVASLPDYLTGQKSYYENRVSLRVLEDANDPIKTITALLKELITVDQSVKQKNVIRASGGKPGPVSASGIGAKASSSAFPVTTTPDSPRKFGPKKGKVGPKHDRRGDPLARRDDMSSRISKPTSSKRPDSGDIPDKNKVVCYYCGRFGHKEAECRTKLHNEERKAVNLKKLQPEAAMPAQVAPQVEPTFTFVHNTSAGGKRDKGDKGHEHYVVFPAQVIGGGDHQPKDGSDVGRRLILLDTGATISIFTTPGPFDVIKPSNHLVQGVAGKPITATGEGSAAIVISGHLIEIEKALYVPDAKFNLLAAKDIEPLHYSIVAEGLVIKQQGSQVMIPWNHGNKFMLEFYSPSRVSVAVQPSTHPWRLWHQRFGHPAPSTMDAMRRAGYPVPESPPDLASHPLKYCETCPLAKLVKVSLRQPTVIDPQYTAGSRWNIDTLGPITPPDINGNVYVLVIVDHATRRYSVHLMPSRDLTFRQIAAQYEWQLAHQPGMTLREIRQDNAQEFKSTVFTTWAETRGITLTYTPTHSPAHNSVAERAVGVITTMMRSLLFQSNLPAAYWGYAVLQGVRLLNLWPRRALSGTSPQQAFDGRPDEIFLKSFGCLALVPFPTGYNLRLDKLQPRRFRAIYLGNVHPKISLLLSIDGLRIFTSTSADIIFDEDSFPGLERTLPTLNAPVQFDYRMVNVDDSPLPPFTGQADEFLREFLNNRQLGAPIVAAEGEVLQRGSAQPPDLRSALEAFRNPGVPDAARSNPKRGRPPGSKNKPKPVTPNPVAQVPSVEMTPSAAMPAPGTVDQPGLTEPEGPGDTIAEITTLPLVPPTTSSKRQLPPPRAQASKRLQAEIDAESIVGMLFETYPADDHYLMVATVLHDSDDDSDSDSTVPSSTTSSSSQNQSSSRGKEPMLDPQTIAEAERRPDWPQWKLAIQSELRSLQEHGVFSDPMECPAGVKPITGRFVLTLKRKSDGTVDRYKARYVARGFTQRPGQDFTATYSPVLDFPCLRLVLGIAAARNWVVETADVKTAYLYGELDHDIFMELPYGIDAPRNLSHPVVKLERNLYGLKQGGRMWYLRYAKEQASVGLKTHQTNPSLFYATLETGPVIAGNYVDDSVHAGEKAAVDHVKAKLGKAFEIKDLGNISEIIGLQVERFQSGIFVHMTGFISNFLDKCGISGSRRTSTPLQMRNTTVPELDIYGPPRQGEKVYDNPHMYRRVMGVLQWITTTLRPDLSFSVSLLARYIDSPVPRHWQAAVHMLRYLDFTRDLGLFFPANSGKDVRIATYMDAGYLSDRVNGRSQTGFVVTLNNTAFAWKSRKQTITATSTTYAELIAAYEAARETFWLSKVYGNIASEIQLPKQEPIAMFEDNNACSGLIHSGLIVSDATKHIEPKYHWVHEQVEAGLIEIKRVDSGDNPADLLTKTLPEQQHWTHCRRIGLRRLGELDHLPRWHQGETQSSKESR